MSLTAAPTAPSRSMTNAQFVAAANAFAAWLEGMPTEFNADIAALAAATAGFTSATSATSWTLATGSKAFTLAESGKLFPLGAQVLVARTSAPGTYGVGTVTAFADPTLTLDIAMLSGAGGPYTDWTLSITGVSQDVLSPTPDTTAMSADLTLTSASSAMQIVTPDAAGYSIILPDATTLAIKLINYSLINAGNYDVAVRDDGGTLLRVLQGGGAMNCGCSSIAAAAGVWRVWGQKTAAVLEKLAPTLPTGMTRTWTADAVTIKLSATLFVFLSRNGTTVYATAYDIATNTVGSATSLGVVGSILHSFAMDATTGVVFGDQGNTSCVAFTVSGTTITAGAVAACATQLTLGQYFPAIAFDGTSKFIVGGYNATQPNAACVSVSGTTCTWGSAITVGAAFGTDARCVYLWRRSATQFIGFWAPLTQATGRWHHITLSATTTLTDDGSVATSVANGYGAVAYNHMPVEMATDEWWTSFTGSSGNSVMTRLTVSGVTLSITNTTVGAVRANPYPNTMRCRAQSIWKIDATHAMMFARQTPGETGGLRSVLVTWGGAAFTFADGADVLPGSTAHLLPNNAAAADGLPDPAHLWVAGQSSTTQNLVTHTKFGHIDTSFGEAEFIRYDIALPLMPNFGSPNAALEMAVDLSNSRSLLIMLSTSISDTDTAPHALVVNTAGKTAEEILLPPESNLPNNIISQPSLLAGGSTGMLVPFLDRQNRVGAWEIALH